MIPQNDISYKLEYFDLNDSYDMNVDGSSEDKIFTYAPCENQSCYLEEIRFMILDSGTMNYNHFGSLGAALANGIEIYIHKAGMDIPLTTIKTNAELIMTFSANTNVGNTSTGFLNDNDYFIGTLKLPHHIRLVDGFGDSVKIKIQDDLTNIDYLRVQALIWGVPG